MQPDLVTSPTERRFVKNYVSTGSVQAAAEMTGISRSRGYRLMKKPSILARMETAMEAAGISDELLASRLRDALDAEKTLQVPDGHGGVTLVPTIDHTIRLKAVEMATSMALKARAEESLGSDEVEAPDDVRGLTTQEIMVLMMKRVTR